MLNSEGTQWCEVSKLIRDEFNRESFIHFAPVIHVTDPAKGEEMVAPSDYLSPRISVPVSNGRSAEQFS